LNPRIGDYGLVHTNGLIGTLIRIFLRSKVNHAFIYIGDDLIVEARPIGATASQLRKYPKENITWSSERFPYPNQKWDVVDRAKELIGTPYDFLDILFLWLHNLGITLPFVNNWVKRDDRMICSQLVAECYAHAGLKLSGKHPSEVTPRDLYERIENGRQR
jgi:uncharacterized protein YycO